MRISPRMRMDTESRRQPGTGPPAAFPVRSDSRQPEKCEKPPMAAPSLSRNPLTLMLIQHIQATSV